MCTDADWVLNLSLMNNARLLPFHDRNALVDISEVYRNEREH
jgi:hypothetical protein